jgi:type II secretory pathway component GspD/PulD (secretin)
MYHNKSLKSRIKNKGTLFILGFVAQAILMILAVTAATTFGDVEQGPMTAEAKEDINAKDVNVSSMTAGAEEDINAKDVNVSSGEDIAAGGTIQSITFDKDRTIKDGLRVLSAMYKKNIVPSQKVEGVMGFTRLYNVTFEEAMDAILGVNFKYEQKGQLIMVYTGEEYKKIKEDKSRMTDKVFTLYYINAAEVKTLITPLLSESGKVTSTTAAGVDTEAGKGGDTTSMRDTVIVYDFPERLDRIGQMIKEIDVRPQQILIEVTILTAKLTETTQFGIDWTKICGMAITTPPSVGNPVGMSIRLASGITAGTTGGLTVNLTNEEIVASITALEDVVDTTVLANPKIMALNKQAGYINIGNKTGYTESTTQSSTGTTSSVAFLDSGTILKFRPFICDDGYVRMEINPEESTATTTIPPGSSTVIPSKTLTQVMTNIMVKDGRTIIIGGLFKEDLTNTDSQVPMVGDLPIVGALFKKTKDANIRTELIILITPHIINEPEQLASESEKKQQDIDRIVHGSRKRISSIARMRVYEDHYANAVRYYSEKKYKQALMELNWIISFRPNALEAVRLKEKILAEANPEKYQTLERIMLDEIRKEQDGMWRSR